MSCRKPPPPWAIPETPGGCLGKQNTYQLAPATCILATNPFCPLLGAAVVLRVFGQVISHCSFHPLPWQRHLLGPGTLVPCIYLGVRRVIIIRATCSRSDRSSWPSTGTARSVLASARHGAGQCPHLLSCTELELPKIWELSSMRQPENWWMGAGIAGCGGSGYRVLCPGFPFPLALGAVFGEQSSLPCALCCAHGLSLISSSLAVSGKRMSLE